MNRHAKMEANVLENNASVRKCTRENLVKKVTFCFFYLILKWPNSCDSHFQFFTKFQSFYIFPLAICKKACMNQGVCIDPFRNLCRCRKGYCGLRCEKSKYEGYLTSWFVCYKLFSQKDQYTVHIHI